MHKSTGLGILVIFASLLTDLRAHHSNAPHYDASKPVSIEGTVTDFEFVNPHSFLHVDVIGADGRSAVWICEIDTVGYSVGVLSLHPGILHSGALHTVERLSVDPTGSILSIAWTANDSKYFSRPLSGEFLYKPSPYPIDRFSCTVDNANR